MKTIVLTIALLAACTSTSTAPTQTARDFTDVTAANTSFTLGGTAVDVTGGRLVVRTDNDGSQTVEDFDVVLGDLAVPGGKLINVAARLGTQAEPKYNMGCDLLLDWDFQTADGAIYPMPTAKLHVTVTVNPDGTASYSYDSMIMAGGWLPLNGASATMQQPTL